MAPSDSPYTTHRARESAGLGDTVAVVVFIGGGGEGEVEGGAVIGVGPLGGEADAGELIKDEAVGVGVEEGDGAGSDGDGECEWVSNWAGRVGAIV